MMAQQTYVTKAGDTVSGIASKYGVGVADVSGYRSGNADQIGIGESLTVNTRDIPSPNTINATNLGTPAYVAPPIVPKTGYAGLIESANAAIPALQTKVDQGEKDIKDKYDALGGENTKKADLYDSEGVYTKEKAYKDITNTITAKDAAYRRKIEKIQEDNPTGQLQPGQQIAIDQVERDWAREKADLSISAAFARDDYTTAKQIVDDKITAETEDLTTQLAGLQFFYEKNESNLSDDRKTLLQEQMTNIQNERDDKKQLLSDIGNVQMEAAKNGAPASVIVAIGKSGDTSSAITAAGKYIGLLDREKANKDLQDQNKVTFSDTQIANGAASAGVPLATFQTFDKDTQNFFINGDLSSAKKSIDDAFDNDDASLDDVNSTIKDMKLPAQGEQYLTQYAEKSSKKPRTVEDYLQKYKDAGDSRSAAAKKVSDDFEVDDSDLQDALVKIYGRTTAQRWLPFGR